MESTKTCINCNVTKDINLFPKKVNQCKDCKNAIARNNRALKKLSPKPELDITITKTCSKCNEVKSITEFYRGSICKICTCNGRKQTYIKNIEIYEKLQEDFNNGLDVGTKKCTICDKECSLLNYRPGRADCIDCERKNGREYNKTERGNLVRTQWKTDNVERIANTCSEWRNNNRDKINKRYVERYRNNNNFRLKQLHKNLQQRNISNILNNKKLTYNEVFIYNWFSKRFTDGMNWGNYGTYWVVDHVIPMCLFDYTNNKHIDICINWRNLQPLLLSVNRQKHMNVDMTHINDHINQLQLFNSTLEEQEQNRTTLYINLLLYISSSKSFDNYDLSNISFDSLLNEKINFDTEIDLDNIDSDDVDELDEEEDLNILNKMTIN